MATNSKGLLNPNPGLNKSDWCCRCGSRSWRPVPQTRSQLHLLLTFQVCVCVCGVWESVGVCVNFLFACVCLCGCVWVGVHKYPFLYMRIARIYGLFWYPRYRVQIHDNPDMRYPTKNCQISGIRPDIRPTGYVTTLIFSLSLKFIEWASQKPLPNFLTVWIK